ncbi:MAG: carotenoid biosynthesis protein [Thermogemmatispora sp.]|uniref:carotenoid biosynthesis protein n=1 Tax=Thermogemmatispora sp. TaxID=1968838 RepID=UPI001A0E25AF|nr:carotenoid biosynthesis protein [Thermogemmatispora sp.]MBE3567536.1 carotenoid biosynthesis protein [Thermogemmatispora sp.]
MRVVKLLFICHLAALVFALGGLLIILPHPELWNSTPIGVRIFQFALHWAGSLHILFGAATMLLFGLLCIDARRTLVFFAASVLISIIVSLLSLTGIPLSTATFSAFPGPKLAGIVPYSLPLSWFYMGFTSYLLASKLTDRLGLERQTLWSLVLGTYFLTVWDLALNAVLVSGHFTTSTGLLNSYSSAYGLPVGNLFLWICNCLLLMVISRWLWRSNLDAHHLAIWLPFAVYTANTGFIMALNLGSGLWSPLLLTAVFVLVPESLVVFPREEAHPRPQHPGRRALSQSTWLLMRSGAHAISHWAVRIRVEGLDQVPRKGPVLIAARHFHYFYDGYALLRAIPRRLHTVVALDWLRSKRLRFAIELGCSLVDWLVVLRSEQFREQQAGDTSRAYSPREVRRYLRQMATRAVSLLRAGEVLVIFPEAYPNIDPHPSPKADLQQFLPFRPGFVKLVELAERDGRTQVAVVPAGLAYTSEGGRRRRWRVTVRFGPPLYRKDFASAEQMRRVVEEQVQRLSAASPPPSAPQTKSPLPV